MRLLQIGQAILRVSARSLLALGLALTLSTPNVLAAAGDLDLSFGGTGIVKTDFFGNYDQGEAVAIQGDGKIVAAGGVLNGSTFDFGVARYNIDGSLDTTFGGGGKLATHFSGDDWGYAVALQRDRKIIVAGYSNSCGGCTQSFALARYNSSGALDTTFGTGGKVTTTFSGGAVASSLLIQPDGKIVAIGYSDYKFALARYNTNGSLDTTFGSGGKVTTAFTYAAYAQGAVLQSDNKIVAVGVSATGVGTDDQFALARYNTNGSLDTSFGTGGKVTSNFTSGYDRAYSAAVQWDGKIVVAGGYLSSPYYFEVARYNSSGTLDAAFSGDGLVTVNITGNDQGQAVSVQWDGKIVVAGFTPVGFAAVRLNTDGSLDSAFGNGGIVTTRIDPSGTGVPSAIAIQGDGKILLAGSGGPGLSQLGDFFLVRYQGSDCP